MTQFTELPIANQSGLQFRQKNNAVLSALNSSNAGETAPTVTEAYMKWLDTSTSPPTMRQRNSGNTAWELAKEDQLKVDLAASSGSELVGIGGGRTQADKNAEFVSVKDYGAVCDGVTYDTVQVQNAINENTLIYINEGCRYKRRDITVPLGCIVVDNSRKIRVLSTSADWYPVGKPEIIPHRGFGGIFPENTMSAFTGAYNLGAKSLECDVQISSDGVPVVIHDSTVDRTTDGTGAVSSFTYAALSALDAGSFFSAVFASARIPKFEDVVKFCVAKGLHLHAEIKGYRTQSDIDLIIDVIEAQKALDFVTLHSFDFTDLQYIRQQNVRLPIAQLGGDIAFIDNLVSLGGKLLLAVDYNDVIANPSIVTTARGEGVDVIVWTVDNPDKIKELNNLGVVKIMSNYNFLIG